jgi:hypothetical protein
LQPHRQKWDTYSVDQKRNALTEIQEKMLQEKEYNAADIFAFEPPNKKNLKSGQNWDINVSHDSRKQVENAIKDSQHKPMDLAFAAVHKDVNNNIAAANDGYLLQKRDGPKRRW